MCIRDRRRVRRLGVSRAELADVGQWVIANCQIPVNQYDPLYLVDCLDKATDLRAAICSGAPLSELVQSMIRKSTI
eukprot:755408-Pyramimonas_sp.AAC.1